MPKTIGIFGGMGSWATHQFFGMILKHSEPDEFRIIIDNNVGIPSRTLAVRDGGIGLREAELIGHMRYCLNKLGDMGADALCVPCNSAHDWYDKLEVPGYSNWLNMIEVTSNAVKAQGYSRPLILGGYVTIKKRLYSRYLPGAVYLSDEGNEVVYGLIQIIKQGKHKQFGYEETMVWTDLLVTAIYSMKDKFDSIILACTELPLFEFFEKSWEWPVIDSSEEYAKATVEYARGE